MSQVESGDYTIPARVKEWTDLSPSQVERGDYTIPGKVKEWAELCPDREVFIFYSDQSRRVLTCRDVHILSTKFAGLLQRRGLKPGDVVCNTLTNSPERIVTDFGIIAAGCVTANGQALLTDGTDLLHIINSSRCRLLVTDTSGAPWSVLKGHVGDIADGLVRSGKCPNLEMVHCIDVGNERFFEDLKDSADNDPFAVQPDNVAIYWCTSGTSGFSKLISESHRTAINSALAFVELFNVGPHSKLFNDRPLGWCGGWPYSYIDQGIPQVLTDGTRTVADHLNLTWRAIVTEKCTFAVLPLAFLKSLSERNSILAQYDQYLLDMVITTGQPFRKHCQSVIGKICQTVSACYGTSEAGYVTSWFCENEEDFEDNLVGKPSSMIEMKIVDEDLNDLQEGENGQVMLKGRTIYGEYVNNPEATRRAYTDGGWYKTGDIGHQDKHGCFFVEGRQSDAIMHGEYIIYPSWVERKLRSCPFIAEVMVVGIPDEIICHRICACVILKSECDVTYDKLKEYCEPMFIEDVIHKMTAKPEFYVVVKSYPVRSTGKPDRRALADIAAQIIAQRRFSKERYSDFKLKLR